MLLKFEEMGINVISGRRAKLAKRTKTKGYGEKKTFKVERGDQFSRAQP